jgi:hypothetical protein
VRLLQHCARQLRRGRTESRSRINALYVLSYATCFSAGIELIAGNVAAARTTLDSAMNRAIALSTLGSADPNYSVSC